MHKRWESEGAEAVFYDGRLSIYAKPSMTASDGTVAVGIEAPWITELLEEAKSDSDEALSP